MFGRHKEYFSKKYRRRTYCMMMMCYVTLMNAFRNEEGVPSNELKPKHEDSRYRNYKPFAPYTEVYGFDEIKITWLPVARQKDLNGFYELYNGDEVEYIGQDLIHIAKRLHPEYEYVFKLRVCSYTPDDCSLFSIARYQVIPKGLRRSDGKCNFLQIFSAMNSIPLPSYSLMLLLAVTTFILWRIVKYVICFFNEICKVDIIPQTLKSTDKIIKHPSPQRIANEETLVSFSNKNTCTKDLARFIGLYNNTQEHFTEYKKSTVDTGNKSIEDFQTEARLPSQDSVSKLKSLNKTITKEYNSSSEEHSSCECLGEEGWSKISSSPNKKRKRRNRSKTVSYETEENMSQIINKNDKSISDSELYKTTSSKLRKGTACELRTSIDVKQRTNIVVVIDNSNIFIGARETACNNDPRLRPRHVKLRINQLLHLIEDGRHVTRGITGASSPINTNEHVWDVYRRAGYAVDLEERRGRDEQRVDEQLHFAIYKALVELPSQTLVIATGDGHKGKSKLCTSFIQCAQRAIEHGWEVEVLSWKHCLSVEWLKLASHYEKIKIKYLDEYLDKLTVIERRNQRKSF